MTDRNRAGFAEARRAYISALRGHSELNRVPHASAMIETWTRRWRREYSEGGANELNAHLATLMIADLRYQGVPREDVPVELRTFLANALAVIDKS